MSVQTEIDRINGEVSDQTDLIRQIKNTLAGKAAGSGGGGGIPYTTGSFTLASTSANVIITHNFNSDKVFVMWAMKDNPSIMQADRKALMGILVSTNVYPERTIDISAYNNDGKAPTS